MSIALAAHQLSVERGGRLVLQALDFTARAGAALITTGPNGVGKTTLIRTIAGFLPPIAGAVELTGGDPDKDLREQLHYIGHQNALKASLTVRENLLFWAAFLGGSGAIDAALERFSLRDLADIPTAYLSAGQKRRTSLARLLVADRPLWLLDEPTTALDAYSRDAVIAEGNAHLASGGIIVAATHLPLPFDNADELRLGAREATP